MLVYPHPGLSKVLIWSLPGLLDISVLHSAVAKGLILSFYLVLCHLSLFWCGKSCNLISPLVSPSRLFTPFFLAKVPISSVPSLSSPHRLTLPLATSSQLGNTHNTHTNTLTHHPPACESCLAAVTVPLPCQPFMVYRKAGMWWVLIEPWGPVERGGGWTWPHLLVPWLGGRECQVRCVTCDISS